MPRTPEQQREYMAAYRAKKRARGMPVAPRSPEWTQGLSRDHVDATAFGDKSKTYHVVLDTPKEAEKAMSAIRRERTDDRLDNPFDDGLEDWPVLIQQVSQRQRDIWLSLINTSTKRAQ